MILLNYRYLITKRLVSFVIKSSDKANPSLPEVSLLTDTPSHLHVTCRRVIVVVLAEFPAQPATMTTGGRALTPVGPLLPGQRLRRVWVQDARAGGGEGQHGLRGVSGDICRNLCTPHGFHRGIYGWTRH